MKTLFQKNLAEHLDVIKGLEALEDRIIESARLICQSLAQGGKLMLCGNGGSAADSQHIAAEFVGRFVQDRRPLAAISLTTDSSALTCVSNDYSFDNVFSRQIEAIGRAGDCLMAISTSGNSPNIVKAVIAANRIGISTIGLLGRDGGKLAPACACNVIVNSAVTARIQEAHILIGHTVCGLVEVQLGAVSETSG